MSKRTYMVRRLVALAVVVLFLWLAVSVFGGIFGGDDAVGKTVDAPPTTNLVEVPVGATTTLQATTTTEPPVKERTTPSTADPAELLIIGDSDAGTFGPYLKTLLDQTGIVTTTVDYKVSSGLARPDFFDWPAHMREVVPQVNPDIVVVTFGGNDGQGLRNLDESWAVAREPSADDTEWREEYGRRVGETMDYLLEGTRTLIWVGIPNDDNPEVTARMQVQDEVVRAEVAKRPNVIFIDTWKRFSGRNGGWAEFVVDPRDGIGKDVRADDGFHLNENGAEILALDIAEAIKADLRDRGATLS
ncbi:MAG: DUF459 domain-containing protein [Ilumatobacteraceae bacterium]